MSSNQPTVVDLAKESNQSASYDNHPIAEVNDHVVRISVMTEPYFWHSHPNSDETFLVIEGSLRIEFETHSVDLERGQLLTIKSGIRHRTRPLGARSVNITIERANTETNP